MSVIEHILTDAAEYSVSTLVSSNDSCTHYCFFLILIPLLAPFHPTTLFLSLLFHGSFDYACVCVCVCVCVRARAYIM